jgi:predicted nucleic acid-binding Zn ribbon protein
MQKAGEFLGKVVRRIQRPEAALAWLAGSWSNVVGETLAAHTRPVRCSSGCLDIAIDGKPWQKQVENLSKEFCARINREWGGSLVREVKFVPSKLGSRFIAHENDNNHTPFVRSRRA